MSKRLLTAALLCALFTWTSLAQTVSSPAMPENINARENLKTASKFSRADFYKIESPKFDFEKALLKTQPKKNNFSGGAKTALWVALFAAGIVTVVVLATRDKKENNNSPCGVGVTTPCPPGCVCIQ